jgi:hypothetical protein
LALALITDKNYQGALDVITPALNFSPGKARSEFYLNYLQDMRYLKGFCLKESGHASVGEALMAANTPSASVQTGLQFGLPRR